jgi:hypothetical protein
MSDAAAKPLPSRPTRIPGDLAVKLEEVLEVLDLSSADYLEPLIRVQIENDYKVNAKAIEAKRVADAAMQEAREKAAKRRDEQPTHELGGES